MELKATPARTIVSGLTLVTLTKRIMTPVAIIDQMNALIATVYGLLIVIVAILWPVIIPPPRRTIPIDAPNAAALDTPNVYGEPSGFLRTHCITVPDMPSAKPAKIADMTLGMLRSQTRMLSRSSLDGSPLLNKIFKRSENESKS